MNTFSRQFLTCSDGCCANFLYFINVNGLEIILGGILANFLPKTNRLGFRASMSQGEDDTVGMDGAFINCSISHNKVLKVTSVRVLDPMMAYREFLTLRMIRSQTPPKCGALAS